MAAAGTVAGGFGRRFRLGGRADSGLYVAQLSSGVSYVAWTKLRHQGWMIVAIRHRHVSRPLVLPAHAGLLGLFTGRSRRVAAVWVTPGHHGSQLHYAFLDSRDRITRQGRVALMPGGSSYPQIAVNDRGDLAAIWLQGSQSQKLAPFLGACDSGGRCIAPQPLRVPAGQYENPAVAVADNGTISAVIGGHIPPYGNHHQRSFGLWTAVGHIDRRGERVSKLAPSGDFPVVAAAGSAGAVAMFTPTADSLAWTFLDPGSLRFTRPIRVRDPQTEEPPVIAANLHDHFVAAWFHFTRFDNPAYELKASIGAGTRPGKPTIIAPADQDPAQETLSAGIDGHASAIITWERFGSHGNHGLFEATRIHR